MIRQYPPPDDPDDVEAPIAKLWYAVLEDCLKRRFDRIHLFLSDPSDLPLPEDPIDADLMKKCPDAFRTFTIRAYSNGGWEDIMDPPGAMYAAFLQRLKIMANFRLVGRPPIEQGRFRFAMRNSVFEIGVTVRIRPDGDQEAMVDLPAPGVEASNRTEE
jgi:hypothetical protein